MEENKKKAPVIDLSIIFKRIIENRRLYYKYLPIVFVVSCIYILGVPRTYDTEAKLVPELESNSLAGGALSSIASSFGFDMADMQTTDAITPLLYPDLLEDNGFATSLFTIRVKSQDGEIDTNYYDYLKNHQQKTIWFIPFEWLKDLIPHKQGGSSEFNPYFLSRKDDDICEKIRDNIAIDFDKKNSIISISVTSQDALISKTLADSVMSRLQAFITEYRTNKARIDFNYYKELSQNAKREYEKARQMYGSLSDANTKVALRSVELKMEDMENDMQLKFNAYTTLTTQLEAAKAKVQERTPAFTVIKGAAVPIKPTGPKRMFFVAGMVFLAFFCISIYVIRDYLFAD